MTLSDGDLLASIQRGDDPAFAELVDRYRPRLLRFAVRSTGDAALAEDLVQETFAAVYAASASYDARFAVSTWIWTILLNLCRRFRRGQRSRERLHTAWAAAMANRPRPDDTAIDDLVRDEQARLLRLQLARLPAAQADALRLRFFAELSFDEIAATMNSSVSGAKVRVRKGLTALSEQLRRDEAAEYVTAAPAVLKDDVT
ncbi:ECF RNA polymerase sigma factor SigW [Caulifigura coniformis]|uniref:RNA polymerase sigma factor n=1 Tax=Caulifigura coniformis TaxID=2527983 RepID=A0A517S7K4_9PLAN|nr:RNA polymerase sigma factor [Caulifigura coniformis]QDT52095.1 ECF RNA polymerase sigma factor SigW [Caulifigura coniformis]